MQETRAGLPCLLCPPAQASIKEDAGDGDGFAARAVC